MIESESAIVVSRTPNEEGRGDGVRSPLSIVIPLYNEAEVVPSLVASIDDLSSFLADQYEPEFLLIDDGSRDGTPDLLTPHLASRRHVRLIPHTTNRGIGAAIQTGILAASHEEIVSMDCDQSYDPRLIAELVPRLTAGVDLVTASPYHVDGAVEDVPLWRLRLSRFASQLYGAACGKRLSCYTSCFRVYRRSAVQDLRLENEGFVGVAELLWKVLERGGQIVEHPARLRSRVAGHSKMRVVRASVGHLRLIARIIASRASAGVQPKSSQASARQPVEACPLIAAVTPD